MTVEPRGVLAKQVQILESVDIGQAVAATACEDQWERAEVQHGACIAARHVLGGCALALRADWTANAGPGFRRGPRAGEIETVRRAMVQSFSRCARRG